jgi:hypothetical protein
MKYHAKHIHNISAKSLENYQVSKRQKIEDEGDFCVQTSSLKSVKSHDDEDEAIFKRVQLGNEAFI